MATDPLKLKYPIVLIHGLGARSAYGPFEYFHGLPKRLRAAGNEVFVPSLTAWQTIETRARELKDQIEERFREGKLNLLGHSMGGLDARMLVSSLGFSDRVASVTTVGTPNRGTTVGDIASGLVPNKAVSAIDQLLGFVGWNSGGFKQITRQYCTEVFAQLAPDVPDVAYFSATSAIPSPVYRHALPIFWVSHRILREHEGENDGFVSVESARWGEHICTFAGDHYAQIGQFLGLARGMDYIAFQDQIFHHLKKQGM